MLPDEVKQRILDEELYRNEVRLQLKPKEKTPTMLWTFLNSSFGIWLLSSVALGFITWGYTKVTSNIEENKKNKSEIQKHDIEISGRITNYRARLSSLKINEDYYETNGSFFSNEMFQANSFVYPEYQKSSLKVLMLEQISLVGDNDKPEIKNALKSLTTITKLWLQEPTPNMEHMKDSIDIKLLNHAKKIDSIVVAGFYISRWRPT